jgi:hypothetical protein
MYEKAENLIAAGYSENSTEVLEARASSVEWANKAAWVKVDKAEDQYSKGLISQTDYVDQLNSALKDAAESGEMSAEQLEELAEKAEDAVAALKKINFENYGSDHKLGNNAESEFRNDAITRIQNNKRGTDDWNTAVSDLLGIHDTKVSKNNTLADLAKSGYYTISGKDRWDT